MAKTTAIVAVMVLSLMLAGSALAKQPQGAPSQSGPGYGRGCVKGGFGPMAKFRQDESVKKLFEQIREKRRQLAALFAKPQVDEARAKQLNQEINALRNQLSEKRLDYILKFKKRNPDWQPRFGQGRRGQGQGRGPGMPGQGPSQ